MGSAPAQLASLKRDLFFSLLQMPPANPADTPKELLGLTRAKNQLHIPDHPSRQERKSQRKLLTTPEALPICSGPRLGTDEVAKLGSLLCQGHSAVSAVGAGLISRGWLPAGLLAPHGRPPLPHDTARIHCPRPGGCVQCSCLLPPDPRYGSQARAEAPQRVPGLLKGSLR